MLLFSVWIFFLPINTLWVSSTCFMFPFSVQQKFNFFTVVECSFS